MTSNIFRAWRSRFVAAPQLTLLVGASTILSSVAFAAGSTFQIGPKQSGVNVMKNAMPKLPTFPALAPKKGFVRGYVKDAAGHPLAGAKLGVRSTATGGFYSGAQGTSDARGYYEIKVPWGAASFYCAGYTVDYGEGRAALGLHPADGETGSFPSGSGAVENWVLLPYGITDRNAASERPFYSGNYYGGSLSVDFNIDDPRPIFSMPEYLPGGSEIELSFVPIGKLVDGTRGRSFTVRKTVSEEGYSNFALNNIPVGTYKVTGRLLKDGQSSPLRLEETGPNASLSFGLEPKQARGEATLTFRPSGGKPESAIGQHGNWDSLAITLKRINTSQTQSLRVPSIKRNNPVICQAPVTEPDPDEPTTPEVTAVSEFKTLGPVDVRLDSVQLLPGNQVRVTATYKNAGAKDLSLPGSAFDVSIVDFDGIGIGSFGELYSAGSDAPEILPYKLDIEGQGQVTLSYLFRLPVGMTAPRTLVFRDSYSSTGTQEFDISTLEIPTAVAAASTPTDAVGGKDSFDELGDFDIRLDGLKRGRGNKIHAFLTVKNVGEKRLRITSSDINLYLYDADGVQTSNIGNLYRASGAEGVEPTGISHSVNIEPKGEAKLRFVFPVIKGQAPKRLVIGTYHDQKQSYDLPVIP